MSRLNPSLTSQRPGEGDPAGAPVGSVHFADGTEVELALEPVGRGASGTGWLSKSGDWFVKLYHSPAPGQQQALRHILTDFNGTRDPDPKKAAYWNKIFLWPRHIVELPRLGVACDPIPEGMQPLSQILATTHSSQVPKAARAWQNRLLIAWRLAHAVERMHKIGLAHSDLSPNNIVADPADGRIRIIDLDGLVVGGFVPPSVVGTPGYIAPELLDTPGAQPSVLSDRHALAVLLFQLLLFRHPLRGPYTFGLPEEEAEEIRARQLGRHGLYIAHPDDARNRPDTHFHEPSLLGKALAKLFQRAFVEGLRQPSARPAGTEWSIALGRLIYSLHPCRNRACPGKHYPIPIGELRCPWCGKSGGSGFPVLFFYQEDARGDVHPRADDRLPAYPGKTLHLWHARRDLEPAMWHDQAPIGRFGQRDGAWWIENLSCPNMAILGRDRREELCVGPGSRLPLEAGTIVRLGGAADGQIALVSWVGAPPEAQAIPVKAHSEPARGSHAQPAASGTTPVAPSPAEPVSPTEWLEKISDPNARRVFAHIAAHGDITEADAIGLLGDARALRRFDRQRDAFAEHLPFVVQIDQVGNVKRYVKRAGP